MARACVFLAAVSLVEGTVAHADPLSPTGNGDHVRAHHEKVAGAALIAIGSALALVGQILVIDAAVNPQHYGRLAHCGLPAGCGTGSVPFYGPEGIPGGVLLGFGGALLLSGIPLYAVGGAQTRRIERSRPTLTLAPQLGAQSALLSAHIRF